MSWMRAISHAFAASSGSAGSRSGPWPLYLATRYWLMTCRSRVYALTFHYHVLGVIACRSTYMPLHVGHRGLF